MTPLEMFECSICLDIIRYDGCMTICNNIYHANRLTAWYTMGSELSVMSHRSKR